MLAPHGLGELLPYDDNTIEHVQTLLETDGVHTLLVQFTDIHGVAKGKLLPLEQLHQVVRIGAGFAGPSIAGTGLPRTGPRSEFYARGELDTAQVLPWMPGVARIVASGFVDGEPFEGCPRQVLQRATHRLAERGWTLRAGIEPEFFLLKRSGADGKDWVPFDDHDRLNKPSYDLKSLPRQAGFLQALRQALESTGLTVEQMDHEDAHGQYEVNFSHDEALRSADHLMLFKLAAHTLAESRGAVFSMMPKPFANQPGSGLHMHVSLWSHEGCVFDGEQPEDDLSQTARWFIGGVLRHAGALCALGAPTVNSYKRLRVGTSLSGTTWAPAWLAHGPNNRTALVRTLPGRFEWRLPDASANPYLALAGLIAAGLDGIDNELEPGDAVTADLFEMPAATKRALGLKRLPQSLNEALEALRDDPVITQALGAALTEQFILLKQAEWDDYAQSVSEWEWQRYVAAF